jgi:hypothetical protein
MDAFYLYLFFLLININPITLYLETLLYMISITIIMYVVSVHIPFL